LVLHKHYGYADITEICIICMKEKTRIFWYNRRTAYTLVYHKNYIYHGITEELPDDGVALRHRNMELLNAINY
jgi:hypothetical protein